MSVSHEDSHLKGQQSARRLHSFFASRRARRLNLRPPGGM